MTTAAEIDSHFHEICKNGIHPDDLNKLIQRYPSAQVEFIEDNILMVTFPDRSKLGLDLRSSPFTWWIPRSQLN